MPVRIYEIAKKLNLESKFVLNKAKELGIAAAKVPSSTLDKITAEFLEEQLAPLAKPFEPSKPMEVTPVTIIHAPAPPPPVVAPVLAPVVTSQVATSPVVISKSEPIHEPVVIRVPVAEKRVESVKVAVAEKPSVPTTPHPAPPAHVPEIVEPAVVVPSPAQEVPKPSVVSPVVAMTPAVVVPMRP